MITWKSSLVCFDTEINTTVYSKQLVALGYYPFIQWRAEGEGGVNGAPTPGIQRVKLQKFKFCNKMIFSIVSLLIHAAWI